MCYSLSFVILMVRSISFLAISRRLGPKVLMLAKMFNDMVGFLLLAIVVLAAYGISTQAILYPNEWRPLKVRVFDTVTGVGKHLTSTKKRRILQKLCQTA